jgi:Lrp/AsnC family transcriptional regulator, regulator of ectoine-degradation genes
MKFDSRDIQILMLLQQDARIKMADLAHHVNLSVTPTWQRVKRLEKAGFITGYHARIDLARLPARVTEIYVPILLEEHRAQTFARFEKAIGEIPEIVSCQAVAGGFDYIARFLVRDMAHYQSIIEKLLAMQIGIKGYYTYVITKGVKTEHIYSNAVLEAACQGVPA